MNMTEERKTKIWEEIISHAKEIAKDKSDDEMTIQDFMVATGMTTWQARNYLDKLVKNGKMKKRPLTNGRAAYSPIE